MKQLLELYGDVEAFLRRHEDVAPASCTKLLHYLDDVQKKICIEVELAVSVDAGLPFVQPTYKLEGDGPLALQCYEVSASLTAAVNMAQPHYPNVLAVSTKLSGGNVQLQQQMVQHAVSCVQPGLLYFQECLRGCLQVPLSAFKAARLFSPQKVQEMNPDCTAVHTWSVFPFLDPVTLGNLKQELPQYIAATEDISPTYSPLEFWKAHALSLPAWAAVAKKSFWYRPRLLNQNESSPF